MDTEITIIGAGVIGLAVARTLSKRESSLFVIEKHKQFGQETSSRNSEVIHSGIYYPKESLKARLCMEGKAMIYQYCEAHNLPYRKCGKLIVAGDPVQETAVRGILDQALENGVGDAVYIGKEELAALEPHVSGKMAAWFPTTGIIDTHAYMQSLAQEATDQGVSFAYAHEVTGIRRISGGYEVTVVQADGSSFTFSSRILINAAGLSADKIAFLAGIDEPAYTQYFWKGEYFVLTHGKQKMVNRLVYQVPDKNTVGLGIHTTPDMNGRVRLGPNAIYLSEGIPDYHVDPAHASDFYASVKAFLPFLHPGDLAPDQAGVRPKLQHPGSPWRDFVIREESERGLPRFINLMGIESPGLTASLSIARYISNLIYGKSTTT